MVEANGVAATVNVVNADVSEVSMLRRADTLVSNWAGPGLLGGGMLRAVVEAR